MNDKHFGLVNYAIQSKGPVPSGLMLEGSAHLAGALLDYGYMPTVYDFNNTDSIRRIAEGGKQEFLNWVIDYIHDEIQNKGTKILGFTLYNNGFRDNIYIAKELKKRNPSLITAAGGPVIGYFREEVLKFTDAFDVLGYGEGDVSIRLLGDVAYKNESLSNVPGAIYRDSSGGIKAVNRQFGDITKLPFPVYDEEAYPFFKYKIPVSTLRTSVGCRWAKCDFCVQPRIDGRYRERGVEDVLKEAETLDKLYKIRNFRLSDPNPTPKKLFDIVNGLPEGHKISPFAYSEPYDIGALKGKLTSLFIGAESSDPRLLLSVNKTKSPNDYISRYSELVEEAKRNGISTVLATIIPFPNDTTPRMKKQLEKVIELNPDFITGLPLTPIPGTRLHKQILSQGEASGFILAEDFVQKMMLWEMDLLAPSSSWPAPPWKMRVDGNFVDNPFAISGRFSEPLSARGIRMLSDEIVLMSYLYNKGLSKDQETRRKEVNDFHDKIRASMDKGMSQTIEEIVKKCQET